MTLAFKPLFDRCVIRRQEKTLLTPGGVHLADTLTAVSQEAVIISVGPGKYGPEGFRPCTVKPGDRVLIGRGAGLDMKIDGEDLTIIVEENVIGVL